MFIRKQKQTMFSEYYRQLQYFKPNIFSQKTRVILPVSTIPAIAANFSKSSSELSLEEAILIDQNS